MGHTFAQYRNLLDWNVKLNSTWEVLIQFFGCFNTKIGYIVLKSFREFFLVYVWWRFLMMCNNYDIGGQLNLLQLRNTINTGFSGDNLHSPFFVCYIPTVWHILHTLVPQFTHVHLHTRHKHNTNSLQHIIWFCFTIIAIISVFSFSPPFLLLYGQKSFFFIHKYYTMLFYRVKAAK